MVYRFRFNFFDCKMILSLVFYIYVSVLLYRVLVEPEFMNVLCESNMCLDQNLQNYLYYTSTVALSMIFVGGSWGTILGKLLLIGVIGFTLGVRIVVKGEWTCDFVNHILIFAIAVSI